MPPGSLGGDTSGVLQYEVQCRAASGGEWGVSFGVTAAGDDTVLLSASGDGPLRHATVYAMRCRAKNRHGAGEWLELGSAMSTLAVPPGPVSAPEELSVSAVSCTARIGAPLDDGGSSIDHYDVQRRWLPNGSWEDLTLRTDYELVDMAGT